MLAANKNRLSLLNALSALSLTLVNGLLGIIVTKLIIGRFGSDFNGLNATANQIVNLLLILEGGIATACAVALFAPLGRKEHDTVNGILAASAASFRRVGVAFLAVGTLVALLYAWAVNSALPFSFVLTLLLLTVLPAAFNLFYATAYRVLLQAEQREYVISAITLFTLGGGHVANIVMIRLGGPAWSVRLITALFGVLNSLLIVCYVKRKTLFLDWSAVPRPALIKGARDVMAQRVTGVIYGAAPLVFLSLFPTGGTVLASVYAVYNNVFVMLKSLLHGVIDAPRHSFGHLLALRSKEQIWPTYAQYELLSFFAIFVLVCACGALILPFIRLYTADLADAARYADGGIALLMIAITALEMMHIPSGHLMNMAGCFRASRHIQVLACTLLLGAMGIGSALWGIYGVLASVLLCATLLCVMEMGYVHVWLFRARLCALLRLLFPFVLVGIPLCYAEMRLAAQLSAYGQLFVYGVFFTAVNALIGLLIGWVFHKHELLALLARGARLLRGG